MKIKTDTPLVKKAREGVMEFLLVRGAADVAHHLWTALLSNAETSSEMKMQTFCIYTSLLQSMLWNECQPIQLGIALLCTTELLGHYTQQEAQHPLAHHDPCHAAALASSEAGQLQQHDCAALRDWWGNRAALLKRTCAALQINHPLDCPICDQGGECDLQDQVRHRSNSFLKAV